MKIAGIILLLMLLGVALFCIYISTRTRRDVKTLHNEITDDEVKAHSAPLTNAVLDSPKRRNHHPRNTEIILTHDPRE